MRLAAGRGHGPARERAPRRERTSSRLVGGLLGDLADLAVLPAAPPPGLRSQLVDVLAVAAQPRLRSRPNADGVKVLATARATVPAGNAVTERLTVTVRR